MSAGQRRNGTIPVSSAVTPASGGVVANREGTSRGSAKLRSQSRRAVQTQAGVFRAAAGPIPADQRAKAGAAAVNLPLGAAAVADSAETAAAEGRGAAFLR